MNVVLVTSVAINVLLLGGSVYMMLVYDSVLPSRSMPTLAGLFALVVMVFLFQAIFDAVRADALLGLANGVSVICLSRCIGPPCGAR